jgi:SAM-dependent methyltransferase
VYAAYGAWAETYEDPGNPIIALEEPAVWSQLDATPAGLALDAACGTGRHTSRLVELGHEVLGIDLTPEIRRRAGGESAGGGFRRG